VNLLKKLLAARVTFITVRGQTEGHAHQVEESTMNEALKFPTWRALFREAVVEIDPQRLSVKVQAAEKAIRDRLRELVNESYDLYERQALIDALATLAVLKRELDEDVPSSLMVMC
jgi:hypothetical protein